MDKKSYNFNTGIFAAALLGLVPLGQTAYLLLISQLGLPHFPGQFAIFASTILMVPILILLASRRFLFLPSRTDLAVLLIVILMMANLAFRTIDPTLRDAVLLCVFVIGPYIATRLLPPDLLRPFLFGMLAACLVATVYTIAFILKLNDTPEVVIRPKLLGADHGVHLVGIAITFLICFVAAVVDAPRLRWQRVVLYAVASLAVALLVVISSRGMAVIAFATVLMTVFLLPRAGIMPRLTLLLCMSISAYLTFILHPLALSFLFLLIPNDIANGSSLDCVVLFEKTSSSDIRLALYTKAIDLFLSFPVFGVGLDNYAENFCLGSFPHSTILQIAAELGVIGLAITGYLLYRLLPKMISIGRQTVANDSREGLVLMTLLICSLGVDQIYGNLLFMPSSMALLGAVASLLAAQKTSQYDIHSHAEAQ